MKTKADDLNTLMWSFFILIVVVFLANLLL